MAKTSAWQVRGRAILMPIVDGLARAGVSPTSITLFGLALHLIGSVVVGLGQARLGALVLIAAALCDALDGQLARRTGRATKFGAFLDSNVDRIEETAVMAGIAAYFQATHWSHAEALVVATLLALAGSLVTSYARARAEGLGLDCKVGWFERPDRVAVVTAGLFLGPWFLVGAILIVLVLSWVTVLQRIHHVHKVTEQAAPEHRSTPAVRPAPPLPVVPVAAAEVQSVAFGTRRSGEPYQTPRSDPDGGGR